MNKKTLSIILIIAMVICVLISMYALAKSAWVAGGRKACSNTDSILVEGFKCEQIIEPSQSGWSPQRNISFGLK